MNENTITRRSALTAGTLAALAAGLLGTTGARPAAAVEPTPAPLTVGTVTNVDDLAAEVRWRAEHVHGLYVAQEEAGAALKAMLTPEQARLFTAYEEAAISANLETWDLYVAELGRHLPGLAPAIRAIWLHIAESRHGRCCRPDTAGVAS